MGFRLYAVNPRVATSKQLSNAPKRWTPVGDNRLPLSWYYAVTSPRTLVPHSDVPRIHLTSAQCGRRTGRESSTNVDSNTLTVQYKDRFCYFDLRVVANSVDYDGASIACALQAALNLSRVPLALCLRTLPGEDSVVCPLSMLIACPSFIATTFRGMSWAPLLPWEEDAPPSRPLDNPPTTPTHTSGARASSPHRTESAPLKVTVPEQDIPVCMTYGPTASVSEGWGRPLTAPPGDRTRGMSRPRPSRREGLGRPMSATPSDKPMGMLRARLDKSNSSEEPVVAPSREHGSCINPPVRPATTPYCLRYHHNGGSCRVNPLAFDREPVPSSSPPQREKTPTLSRPSDAIDPRSRNTSPLEGSSPSVL